MSLWARRSSGLPRAMICILHHSALMESHMERRLGSGRSSSTGGCSPGRGTVRGPVGTRPR